MSSTTGSDPTAFPSTGTDGLTGDRTTITFASRRVFGVATVTGLSPRRRGERLVRDPTQTSTMTAVIDLAAFSSVNAGSGAA